MEMSNTEKKFAEAALAVFRRFGVRKATMEEIAVEAGVSKPTLYATFRNKDAALGGAIRLAKGDAIRTLMIAWQVAKNISEKLDIFFDQIVLSGFDMLHNSPDASAFDTAVGKASSAAITETRQAEIDSIQTAIDGFENLEAVGLGAPALASFVVSSAMNAKRNAQSRADLEDYLKVLKISVLGLLEADELS